MSKLTEQEEEALKFPRHYVASTANPFQRCKICHKVVLSDETFEHLLQEHPEESARMRRILNWR